MQLRQIQLKDNAQVAQVIRTVMPEYDCVGDGYSINDPELDTMFETYDNAESYFWVLETEEGKVVGCGGIAPLKGGEAGMCELQKMYFLKEGRGHGFGKQLIEQSLEKARALGYTSCYLETVERMREANGLYQKMGFEVLDGPLGCTGHGACDTRYLLRL